MKVSENKPHSIHLRLTDEQYQFLADNAELLGVNVSETLRMMLNTIMVTSNKISQNVSNKLNSKLGDLYENEKNTEQHII